MVIARGILSGGGESTMCKKTPRTTACFSLGFQQS
jgi:hypothetical protein